jgi:hypothetical protein
MPAPLPGFSGETGEVCTGCVARDDEIRALDTEKKGWIGRYQKLKKDREAEARSSEWWPVAREVFELWQALTGKRRARFTYDRYELIRPFLEAEGVGDCKAAVHGLLQSSWHTERGVLDFETVFSSKPERQRRFERFRDLGLEGDPDPFYVGLEPNLFDPDAGLTKRLRERVLALELNTDAATQVRLLGEIHELTKGSTHDTERAL